MTVYFTEAFRNKTSQAYTHALVVGVSRYPRMPASFGLGQLTSPSYSARWLAKWLLENFSNESAPLGSVEVLISEMEPQPFVLSDQREIPTGGASMAEFKSAFYDWLDRCNENPDNVAIFYYCGHGFFINADQILLLADFGANRRNPYEHALNFSQLFIHLDLYNQLQTRLQLYFIDACGSQLLEAGEVGLDLFAPPNPRDLRHDPNKKVLVLKATAPGFTAYGRRNLPSRFTEALVLSLDGRACPKDPVGGRWVVDQKSLDNSVYEIIQWMNREENREEGDEPQIPEAFPNRGKGFIHYRSEPPVVPVYIDIIPPEAAQQVHLQLKTAQPPDWTTDRNPAPGKWEIEQVRIGDYVLQASFDPPNFNDVDRLIVTTPGPLEKSVRLEVPR